MSEGIRLGAKVRGLRRREGLSQARLAEMLGISASYLNLIEHNQRAISAPLLIKLAQVFQDDLQTFADEADTMLRSELMEVFADPLFENHSLTTTDVRELALAAPAAARAVIHLYRSFRSARISAQTLAERLSEGMALSSIDRLGIPTDEVSDFLQARMNYFPELEVAAEALRQQARLHSDDLYHGLQRHLHEELGIRLSLVRGAADRGLVRRFDSESRTLTLSESLPLGSRNFQLAHQIGLLTQSALLDRFAGEAEFVTEESRALCRVALANYFAAAVMMPYEPFLEAAREERYDVDLLGIRFGANFEQVCHRLTTLRRPGAEGIPFHFLRVDVAGNISKRFSASGIPISRFGACPRWILHSAFLTPGRIITQLARMPDGSCYFCLARTVTREARGYHVPKVVHAITLGCKVEHAHELVYADGIDLTSLSAAVPIGSSCRMCERMDCEQRAFPPIHYPLGIDENSRGISFYAPVQLAKLAQQQRQDQD
jgi:predicted transcriptional regulator/transcriptional regulator with XRE-family HTH domain